MFSSFSLTINSSCKFEGKGSAYLRRNYLCSVSCISQANVAALIIWVVESVLSFLCGSDISCPPNNEEMPTVTWILYIRRLGTTQIIDLCPHRDKIEILRSFLLSVPLDSRFKAQAHSSPDICLTLHGWVVWSLAASLTCNYFDCFGYTPSRN